MAADHLDMYSIQTDLSTLKYAMICDREIKGDTLQQLLDYSIKTNVLMDVNEVEGVRSF